MERIKSLIDNWSIFGKRKSAPALRTKSISKLPNELLQGVLGDFLGPSEKVAVATASTSLHNLFKTDLKKEKTTTLLHHVIEGAQDKVINMLSKNPDLLIQKGDVTDYIGRKFDQVSPWELMLWILDTFHLGSKMLDCIPKGEAGDEIRQTLLKQFDSFDVKRHGNLQKGVRYVLKEGVYEESYCNFAVLEALKTYRNNLSVLAIMERKTSWLNNVSNKQLELPLHILHYYYYQTRSRPLPKEIKSTRWMFSSKTIPPSNTGDDALSYQAITSELGISFGLLRGENGKPAKKVEMASWSECESEGIRLATLRATRISDAYSLQKRLYRELSSERPRLMGYN